MSRTDSASRDRRDAILAAAIRVLARDGLAEATTRKIAAEAQVNQATLGYYFGNKDGLLLAVLREMMRITNEIARAAVPVGAGLREAIAESLTAFWASVEASPELQVMQYELTLYALRHPASAWLAKQQYDGYCAVVEALFTEACAAAAQVCAISCAELARFVVGGLDGMILQFISDHDRDRARHDLANLIAAVVALAEGAAVPANGAVVARGVRAMPPPSAE
ncbi:MAG: TetR/AcrR family transcriptional regulator [Ktedonobacterales bacterium]|nr:TetR/AcrR family transcriptional regulator [Ktedonobacterales bacterium]